MEKSDRRIPLVCRRGAVPDSGVLGVHAAAGADDNHSATAALLQAAPIFLKLARQGRLARDIWLLHRSLLR